MYEQITLAAAGSTGNNTHASVDLGGAYESAAFQFVVDAAGTTVTWKVQGSPDGHDVSDASSHWYDVAYVTDASDTSAVTALTSTAVGAKIIFLDVATGSRKYRKFRLVTSANTGITYHADIFRIAHD